MSVNEGTIDRALRIIVGLAIRTLSRVCRTQDHVGVSGTCTFAHRRGGVLSRLCPVRNQDLQAAELGQATAKTSLR